MRAAASLTLVATLALAACGSPAPVHKKKPSPVAVVTPAPTPATPAPTPITSPAPIIVQVENSPEARPQSGLQGANVVYEYATEGGITRFSAIYFTPNSVGNVGPVRSARLVTLLITGLFHGTLLFSGASNTVTAVLTAQHLPSYSEGAFNDTFRVGNRAAPHNLYTSGPRLADLLQHSAQPPVAWQIWQPRASSFGGGSPANQVTVPLSGFETPQFAWNASANGYTRTEPTGPFTDADSGQPLVVPNLVVLQVPVQNAGYVEDVNGAPGLEYSLTGTGVGQLFVGGQQFPIAWTQPPTGGPPSFALPGGTPAPLANGLVWIALDPIGQPATFGP